MTEAYIVEVATYDDLPDDGAAGAVYHVADNEWAWRYCDISFYNYATVGAKVTPHQHHPEVFNANPAILTERFGLLDESRRDLVTAMRKTRIDG